MTKDRSWDIVFSICKLVGGESSSAERVKAQEIYIKKKSSSVSDVTEPGTAI